MNSKHAVTGVRIGWLLLLMAPLLLVAACARPALQAPMVNIQNRTGKPISKVTYRECKNDAAAWETLNQVRMLPSNQDIAVDLPIDCSDLRAFYEDGKIAGTQQDIKKRFSLIWTLH